MKSQGRKHRVAPGQKIIECAKPCNSMTALQEALRISLERGNPIVITGPSSVGRIGRECC